MTAKVDPVAWAREAIKFNESQRHGLLVDEREVQAARVVLAAAEVCSHQGVERVILDATLVDDIKALKAALEGR